MFTIGLQPTQSVAEVGRKILAYHFHDFLKHEKEVRSNGNIETLHDMRVATRRMRATIRIFESGFTSSTLKFLKNGLKETAQILGAVRDLDVLIEKFTAHQQELSIDEQLKFAPLLEYCHLKRNLARTKMLAHLDSKTYKNFKAGVAIFVKKKVPSIDTISQDNASYYQIRHIGSSLIYKRYETVRMYESFLNKASLETLHQLRIDSKYFRYTLENLQEILGHESTIVLSEIKQIQNHLGDLNDAKVACQFLENFLSHWKNYRQHLTTSSSKKPTAIVNYLKIKIAEREFLLETFPEVWHHFNTTQLRQYLALAISTL